MLKRQFNGKDIFLVYSICITIFCVAVLVESNIFLHFGMFCIIMLSSYASNSMTDTMAAIWQNHILLTFLLSFQLGISNWQFLTEGVGQFLWMLKPYLALFFLATSSVKPIFNTNSILTTNAILMQNFFRLLSILVFCSVFYSFNPLCSGLSVVTTGEKVWLSLILYVQHLITFWVSCYILEWPTQSLFGTIHFSTRSIMITILFSFCFVALQYHYVSLFQPLIVSYYLNQYTLSVLFNHYWGNAVQLFMTSHWDQLMRCLLPYRLLLLVHYAKPQEECSSHWDRFWSAFPPAICMVLLTCGVLSLNPFESLELFNEFCLSISPQIVLNLLFIWSNNLYAGWAVQYFTQLVSLITSYDHQTGFGLYQEHYRFSGLDASQDLELNIAIWLSQTVVAYGFTRILPRDEGSTVRTEV